MNEIIDKAVLHNAVLQFLDEIVLVCVKNGGCVAYINDIAKRTLEYTDIDINSHCDKIIRYPLNGSEPFADYLKDLRRKEDKTEYAVMFKKDGTEILVEANFGEFVQDGTVFTIIIAKDVTQKLDFARKLYIANQELQKTVIQNADELRQNESRLESYKLALDASSIVSITDVNGRIKYVNENFEKISGFSKDEVIGKYHSIVKHPDVPKEIFTDMWRTIKNKKIWRGRLQNRTKDGKSYFIDSAILPILDAYGTIVEYIAVRHDITELIRQKEELQKAAKTDPLTLLGNRLKLSDILHRKAFAQLALIDIDGFHEINDFYGADFGDEFIKTFAINLSRQIKGKYEIFHLHGDEFAILNTTSSKDQFSKDMFELNNAMLTTPIEIGNKLFPISTTLSISFEEPLMLLPTVNMAHSFAKRQKEKFLVYSYTNSLEKEYEENIKWAKIIRNAIADDRIIVYYQPIADIKTKAINKYEALVRLIDESGNIISPFQFLECAKKSGQYVDITKIVINKTVQKAAEYADCEFSINLTIEDILNKSLNDFVAIKLADCEFCHRLTFELVESEGIQNFEEANGFIHKIRSLGCKLAIDDFGTGYSNFEYLLKLKTDYVKIDGSLIQKIASNQDYFDIVKTIVEFANIKKLIVIAEFVSDEAVYDKVLELGIMYGQGYYFSKPIEL